MTPSIVLREAHDVVDFEQLAALFVSAGWADRAADRERLVRLVQGSRWVVSAWDEARLVGFARAISDGTRNAYVCSVAVLPEYRGSGVGRAVVQHLVRPPTEARDGVQFVLHARPEVQPFYRKIGFEDAPDMLRMPRTR